MTVGGRAANVFLYFIFCLVDDLAQWVGAGQEWHADIVCWELVVSVLEMLPVISSSTCHVTQTCFTLLLLNISTTYFQQYYIIFI